MNKLAKWFKKHFIPHVHNQYKPHFLRHESVIFFLFLIVIFELGFLVQVFVVFDKTKFLAEVLPGILTSLTNKERQEIDLPPLISNELLNRAAQLKAEDMANKGYFAHTSPDGKSPWYWLGQVGYNYTSAGENLAVNFFESSDVSRAWMNSPTHKANIVKPNYTEIGIGVANGVYEGRHTVFVAQFFGTPLVYASNPTPIINPVTTVANEIKTVKPAPVTKPVTKPATVPIPPKTITPTQTEIIETQVVLNNPEIQVLGEEIIGNTTPAPITKSTPKISGIKQFLEKVLTSPGSSLSYLYILIGIITLFVMLLIIFVRSELEHPKMLMRGLSLVVVIIGLLYVNFQVISLETKVPTDGITASVIAN